MALRQSGLPFRRPPATGPLGRYPDRTPTGKPSTAFRTHTPAEVGALGAASADAVAAGNAYSSVASVASGGADVWVDTVTADAADVSVVAVAAVGAPVPDSVWVVGLTTTATVTIAATPRTAAIAVSTVRRRGRHIIAHGPAA